MEKSISIEVLICCATKNSRAGQLVLGTEGCESRVTLRMARERESGRLEDDGFSYENGSEKCIPLRKRLEALRGGLTKMPLWDPGCNRGENAKVKSPRRIGIERDVFLRDKHARMYPQLKL